MNRKNKLKKNKLFLLLSGISVLSLPLVSLSCGNDNKDVPKKDPSVRYGIAEAKEDWKNNSILDSLTNYLNKSSLDANTKNRLLQSSNYKFGDAFGESAFHKLNAWISSTNETLKNGFYHSVGSRLDNLYDSLEKLLSKSDLSIERKSYIFRSINSFLISWTSEEINKIVKILELKQTNPSLSKEELLEKIANNDNSVSLQSLFLILENELIAIFNEVITNKIRTNDSLKNLENPDEKIRKFTSIYRKFIRSIKAKITNLNSSKDLASEYKNILIQEILSVSIKELNFDKENVIKEIFLDPQEAKTFRDIIGDLQTNLIANFLKLAAPFAELFAIKNNIIDEIFNTKNTLASLKNNLKGTIQRFDQSWEKAAGYKKISLENIAKIKTSNIFSNDKFYKDFEGLWDKFGAFIKKFIDDLKLSDFVSSRVFNVLDLLAKTSFNMTAVSLLDVVKSKQNNDEVKTNELIKSLTSFLTPEIMNQNETSEHEILDYYLLPMLNEISLNALKQDSLKNISNKAGIWKALLQYNSNYFANFKTIFKDLKIDNDPIAKNPLLVMTIFKNLLKEYNKRRIEFLASKVPNLTNDELAKVSTEFTKIHDIINNTFGISNLLPIVSEITKITKYFSQIKEII
ncbi:Uncharacterised protein [Metamycoplasma arthritidis]|uniref:Lipoprotein n=1 Tax=Metamycoplasma arthritidis (strain 158L3-1) TaxID=243272 RepID=B3PLZ5_META1|nr:variable surface lipoprotein [Metamycoplasma arthritidis]ACF07047.1 hypothetical protein MARTH_orf106 [Metamycoplasma arthritidis 158L3-1]VEU78576.1 Uncharacterised protein [Metamycoplasma arthritidis]